jgi:hypothetical protein
MSAYDNRLHHLQEHAKDAYNETEGLADDLWPDKSTRERFEKVIAYARTVLEATDAELLSASAASMVEEALVQISNSPTSAPPNADAWAEEVLDALAHLPIARGREMEQAVKDAAANFQRSAGQRLNALQADFDRAKSELETLGAALEERKTELSTAIEERRTEIATQIEALQAEFEQKLATYSSQIESEQAALSKIRTTHTSEFEELEEQRATAAKERLARAEEELNAFQERATSEVEARVGEIRRMEEESAQLVGAIGLAGTAERYGEEVEDQKGIADIWRRTTVVLALLAVGGVIFAASEKHPVAESFAGKLSLSLILGGIAAYAARQSSYHRRREQRARDLQLELTAFSPFIEPLSHEQQEEERVIMTRKTFGKTTTSVAQAEEPGPMPLSFLLRRKEKEADDA